MKLKSGDRIRGTSQRVGYLSTLFLIRNQFITNLVLDTLKFKKLLETLSNTIITH